MITTYACALDQQAGSGTVNNDNTVVHVDVGNMKCGISTVRILSDVAKQWFNMKWSININLYCSYLYVSLFVMCKTIV